VRDIADFVAVALRVLAELPELVEVRLLVDAVDAGTCDWARWRATASLAMSMNSRRAWCEMSLDDLSRCAIGLPLSSSRTFTSGKSGQRAVREAFARAASPQLPHLLSTPAVSSSISPCDSKRANASLYVRRWRERMMLDANSTLCHGQLRCELDKRALRPAVLVAGGGYRGCWKVSPATSAGPDPRGRRCCRATAPRGPTRCPVWT